MQFKKLAAIAGSAVMAGLALSGPVLATTVNQLGKISGMVSVTDSTVSFPIFVIGATAAPADVAGAVDVAVNMAANAKTTSSVTTNIPGESVTGGTKIATTGIYLTPYSNPQAVKGIITASDIPSLLTGGIYSSASGGSYNYKQYLYVLGEGSNNNPAKIKFERPTTENSPRVTFKAPASSTLYTYKLTFSTPVSLSGVTDDTTLKSVIQGTTINMLGKDFVISDATWSSGISTVTMLGGKSVLTVETGTPKTVTIDSKDYTVTLTGVAAQTIGTTTTYTAIGDINGEAFTLKAGDTKVLSDGTTLVAAIKVFQGKTGAADYATIAVGADKIQLSSAGTVTKGTTVVSELTSSITSSTAAGWSSMTITYAPSQDNWLSAGGQITEPFSSTFNIKFNSVIPEFTDTVNRQTFTFSPSGYNLLFTYKNAADVEKQMYTLYTTDGSTWRYASAAAGSPTNFDNDYRDIVFDEGKNISSVEQDYFVVQKGGFSHIMQFTSYTNTTKTFTFTDESGNSLTAVGTTGVANDTADLIVDGNTYKVLLLDDTKKIINIDLNGNTYIAGQSSSGNYGGIAVPTVMGTYTGREYSFLMPKFITTGQGGIFFSNGNKSVTINSGGFKYADAGFAPIRLSNVTNVVTVGEWSDTDKVFANQTATITIGATGSTTYGNYTVADFPGKYIDYQVACTNTTGTYTCVVGIGKSGGAMQTQPGLALVEEAQQGGTTHNWLFVPVNWDATNSRTYVGTTLQSDDTNYADVPVIGTATQYKGMTTYGTLTDHLASTLGGSATVSYPDVFLYGNVYVLTPEGTISSGGTGGTVTTDRILPITSDVVKLDSELSSSDKQNYDLVVVGGPCINQLAAEALDKTYPACGAESGIPENAGLIKLVADKFATGKTVLLIAGWEAADTDLAARIVQTGFPFATAAQKEGSELTVTGTVASPSYS